jgi:hypothetical protein
LDSDLWGVLALARGAAARDAYAIITAWWLVAYSVAKFGFSQKIAPYVGAMFLALFMLQGASGRNRWFYHDLQGASLFQQLVIAMMEALFVVSPLIFDFLVGYTIRVWSKYVLRAKQN